MPFWKAGAAGTLDDLSEHARIVLHRQPPKGPQPTDAFGWMKRQHSPDVLLPLLNLSAQAAKHDFDPQTRQIFRRGIQSFVGRLLGVIETAGAVAGTDLQHVPFRSLATLTTDLLSNRVNMCFCNISQMLPLIREGKLRGLAVTSLQRVPQAPDLPTMHESGFPGFDVTSWFALLAPAGTPAAVIAKLHTEVAQIVAQPEMQDRLTGMGMQVIANSPAELAAVIRAQIQDRKKLIEAAKIQLQ